MNGIGILLGIRSVLSNLDSHYYYYFLGSAIGGLTGHVLTVADRWFSLGIITPEDPWDRFN